MKNKTTFLVPILTVLFLGLIMFSYYFDAKSYATDFTHNRSDFGALETITGVPYTISDNKVTSTEEMAHLRIPYRSGATSKKLTIKTTYQLDGANILEVGLRKGSFWLDYERIPIRNKKLDNLVFTEKKKWKTLQSGDETIFLSPYYSNNYTSFNEFFSNPPKEAPIGLYGNTKFNCTAKNCKTEPFQTWSDPKKFQAIYARYTPTNDNAFRTVSFDLSLNNVYQNPDGSFDLMYFAYPEDDAQPIVYFREITATITSAIPNPKEIYISLKQNAKDLIFRKAYVD